MFLHDRTEIFHSGRRDKNKHKNACVSEGRGLYKENFRDGIARLFLFHE